MKIVQDGRVVPLDTTDEELECLLRFDENRITGRVFRRKRSAETALTNVFG
jgi:hypothetical protein